MHTAYFGEYGYEMVLHAPYTNYLHSLGFLNQTAGPSGSGVLHPYSPHHVELENTERRFCLGPPTHAGERGTKPGSPVQIQL